MESLSNSNIEDKLRYLKEQSMYFNKLFSDSNFLYQEINNLSQEQIEYMISFYSGSVDQPVNTLRLLVLNKLKEGIKIDERLISDIKNKFRSKDLEFFKPYLTDKQIEFISKYPVDKNPFHAWTNPFRVLYTLVYYGKYKDQIENNLEIIANYLKSKFDLRDYKINVTGFDGPQNQGQNNAWVNIFPICLGKYNNAINYFFEIKDGTLLSGLSKSEINSFPISIPTEILSKEYSSVDEAINSLKKYKNFEQEQNKKIYKAFKIRNYWAVGIDWDGKNKLTEFNKNKYWEIGWSKDDPKGKKTWENIKKVNVGDYIAFKTSPWGKNIDVRQISKVIRKDENKGLLYFEQVPLKELYKGKVNGNLGGTLAQITNYEDIQNIFGDLIFMKKENILAKNLAELLEKTHNIILHGAPGTGKTHLALDIVEELKAEKEFVQFHPSYDYTDFVEGLRPNKNRDENAQIDFQREDGIFKKFCKKAIKNLKDSEKSQETLNKEEYINDVIEDFINNAIEEQKELKTVNNSKFFIKDITEDEIIVSVPENDIYNGYQLPLVYLKKLLETNNTITKVKDLKNIFNHKVSRAEDSYLFSIYQEIKKNLNNQQKTTSDVKAQIIEKKKYILIIDEINRGDLSKIFGELFFSIDPGYRGIDGKIKTQYQNLIKKESDDFFSGFYVPENVYIIGTMNDIDRSVESMDFAFRRRFTFIEIKAEDTVEDILSDFDSNVIEKCKKIMKELNEKINKIDGLGPDYHIGAAYFRKLEKLDYNYSKLWDYHLKGLLKEYFRGLEQTDLLEQFKKEYDELIK